MRTVVIVSEAADAKGGASIAALRSALVLAKYGVDVRVFAATGPFNPPEIPPSNLTCKTLEDGLDLIKSGGLKRMTQSLWNGTAASQFGDFISDLEPQHTVVHIHSFSVNLTGSVVREAVKRGFPVVYTAHDYSIACPYSGFYNYNTGAPCGKKALSTGCATTLCTESKSIPGKTWHLAKGSCQKSIGVTPNGFAHAIFLSDFSRRILQPYLPEGTKTSLVPNALSLPKEGPRKLKQNAPFLFAGRLTKEKGADLLAEAAKAMNCEVWIVGSGPEEAPLQAQNPRLKMLGWKSGPEVRELMRQSRALVFPSRWYEGQPLAVQEAQSLGLPVISSDVCAASETIRHGIDGLLFRSGDAEHLRKQMTLLLDDEINESIGQAAYDHFWADPPTAEKHLRLSLEVYEEVLESLRR
ncbi:MAG: glycosyltransferase family 4 protein [Fimbriimonas sp.]